MKIRIPLEGNTLGPFQLLWRFTQETIITAAIYIVLVAVTLVLGYFAGLEQEPKHKYILETLEFFILIASSLVVFLFIVSLTGRVAIDLSRDFVKWLSGNEPMLSEPVEISIGEGHSATGSVKSGTRFPLIISSVVLLGMLGAWEVHKRQVEGMRQIVYRQSVENERLRDTAEKNFAALCRAGGGLLHKDLTCHFRDGRVVPLRLVDPTSPETK